MKAEVWGSSIYVHCVVGVVHCVIGVVGHKRCAINCDIPSLSASVVRNVGGGEMGRFNWGFDKLGGVVTL